MSFELPPELWLRVFGNLPWFTIPAIHAVSLLFSELSYGFLFAEFYFSPKDDTTGRDLEKLAFWSSKKIAPHVRCCFVNLSHTSIEQESPSPIVSAYFEAVSRFPNLQHLTCSVLSSMGRVEIPALRVESLPRLRSLQLHAGLLTRPAKLPIIPLKLEYFSYTQIPRSSTGATEMRPSYLSFFDPTTLRHLYLRASSMTSIEQFLEDRITMASFHNLHILELALLRTTFVQLHACLYPFPVIRELTLKIRAPCRPDDPLPATPLSPHLRIYTGPAYLLPLILLQTAPQALTLTPAFHFADAPALLSALRGSGGPRASVTSLSLRVRYTEISEESCRIIPEVLAFLPNIGALSMAIFYDLPMLTPSNFDNFCECLANTLRVATVLENVELQWHLEAGDVDMAVNPSVEQLKAALFSALPSLKTFSGVSSDIPQYVHGLN